MEKLVAKRANDRLSAIAPNPYGKKVGLPIWAKVAIPSVLAALVVAIPLAIGLSGGTQPTYAPGTGEAIPEDTRMEPNEAELLVDGKRYLEAERDALPRCIDGKSIEEVKGEWIGKITKDVNEYLAGLGGFELYRINGSSSKAALLATDGITAYYYLYVPNVNGSGEMDGTPKESRLLAALEYNGVNGNYTIETYGLGRSENEVYSYSVPIYEFKGLEAEAIVNSIDALDNDYFGYYERLAGPDTKRNPEGMLMGASYLFVITDGTDVFRIFYVSQFHVVSFWNSRVDISGSDAFATLDAQIEMDYDEHHDPMKN
ncbi:MAG: hypothetical protein K6F32_02675 [Bacilli bacterium]|nr:hypothetical protein [Bacilli bacterium]